jgi:GAF domain-containing protein
VAAPAPAPASFDLSFESAPYNAAPASQQKAERVSRPRLAAPGRRRAGEDLIGELFEFMHELHFQRDVATGADFVLSVLNEMLPCEGALIHVFDINTGHFVVVRAKGPNASTVLLQRMPDQDPFVQLVMRSPRSISIQDAASDPRFNGPRWMAVGVAPKYALCGGVQLGGRYLGLIELVNPLGDTPFHTSELNALDYICEQFADFLSKKPLVLAADVVLARV